MTGSYWQRYVGCPFYKNDDGSNKIKCEGLVDNSTIGLSFQRPRDFRRQMEVFCCDRYICCEIYRMLMDNKYEEE